MAATTDSMSAFTSVAPLLGRRRPLDDRIRVLVADDEPQLRTLLTRLLTREGYDVTAVASGAELVSAVREADEPFDLIVSDVMMPQLSGLDALRVLADELGDTPVLLMTAMRDERLLREATEAGALGVIAKPFELDVVRTAVAALTARFTHR